MATVDYTQKALLDASQMIEELAKLKTRFSEHAKSVNDAVDSYLKITKAGEKLKGQFSIVNEEGLKLDGTLKKVGSGYQVHVKAISQTTEALKKFQEAQREANLEAAKVQAQSLIKTNTQIVDQPVPDKSINALRAAQAKLTNALASDLKNGEAIAVEMFDKLKRGVVDTEFGIRLKIQGAVASLLSVQRQITREIEKQNSANGPTPSARNAANLQAAATAAQSFISGQAGVAGIIPANLLASLNTAQSKLTKALGDDLTKSIPIAEEIFNRLKSGVSQTESGIRLKIQSALISVLNVAERIQKAQKDLASPAAPANTITPAQLQGLKLNLATQFPAPSTANLSAVLAYQRALDGLILQASKGKLTFDELIAVINKVKVDPRAVNNFGVDGDKIAAQFQKLILAYNNAQKSAKDLENQGLKTGNSLLLSFDQFVKLLEIQVIHRAFGALITAMQNSIAKAAELQVRISEIRTVSQNAGIGFTELQVLVRNLSDAFGKSQLDVAEAAYQGFSNQVLRTAADLRSLNDVLLLSRITNASVAASMEAFSSVVNSYRLGTFESSAVTAELFKAVELGRFRLEDVANSMGRVTVVASQLGVSFSQASGLLAQLTVNGVSADEAMTQISSIMQALLKPSDAMKTVFRDLGVENGQAAIQTFGFVNVLQRLFQVAQSGNQEIAALFPNVRALRGVLGGTAGGGVDELQNTIDQIRNAGQSAENAVAIIAESAGDRIRKEFNKVSNYFVSDFGNSALSAIERVTAPFGGLAEVVKGFGRSVTDTFALLDNFGTLLIRAGTLGQISGANIETLVKSYVAYKGAMLGLNVAQGASAAVAAFEAAQRLKATQVTASAVATENLFTLEKIKSVVASTSTAAVELTVAAGRKALALVTSSVTVIMQLFNVATYQNIAANIAAVASNAGLGVSYVALAIKMNFATVAANILKAAMPFALFAGLAVSVGYALGAFDGIIERWTIAGQRAIALREQTALLERQLESQRDQENRAQTNEARLFREDLSARSSAANRVLAELRRQSNALVDAQKEAVKLTEEQVKESLDRVNRSMTEGINNISTRINKFRTNIEQSLRFEASFADRESARGFQAALDAAGERAEVQTGLQPLGQRDQDIENYKREERLRAFGNQNLLIQDRITQLQREARELSRRGDQESIESARRKFEEIRRLTEQQENLARNERRAQAQDTAVDAARRTGQFVTASYDNGLARLRERLRQIQEEEARAEQLFRQRQAERQAAAEQERRDRQAAAQRFIDANRELQRLQREAINADGTVAERFRDRPNEERGAGLRRFQEEFDRIQERLRSAGAGAGADPILVEQAIVQLGANRIALELQIQRTITNNAISEKQREIAEIDRLIREAAAREQQRIAEARNVRTTLLPTLARQLNDADRTARELQRQALAPQRVPVAGRPDGREETAAEVANRVAAFIQARRQFEEARRGVETLITAASNARTPEEQQRTMRELSERIARINEQYREMARLGAGAARIRGEDVTGFDVASGRADTVINQTAQQVATAAANLGEATRVLNELRARSAELENQLLQLPAELRLIAAGLGDAGAAAQAQAQSFQGFAAAVAELNRQIQRLREQPPLVVPQLPGAPAGGFAEGGLIGNTFSSKGPDDTLIWAKRGEYVVNPDSTRRFHSVLTAINAGHFPRHYANGGVVNQTTLGDVTIHVDGSSSPSTTARAVLKELKREKRRGNGGF